jgi:hypothetical protein
MPAGFIALVSMKPLSLDDDVPEVPVAPAVALAADALRSMQPSTVIVSALADERVVLAGGKAVGACGVSPPVRGCDNGGADGVGDGV